MKSKELKKEEIIEIRKNKKGSMIIWKDFTEIFKVSCRQGDADADTEAERNCAKNNMSHQLKEKHNEILGTKGTAFYKWTPERLFFAIWHKMSSLFEHDKLNDTIVAKSWLNYISMHPLQKSMACQSDIYSTLKISGNFQNIVQLC